MPPTRVRVLLRGDPLDDGDKPLEPVVLRLVGHLLGHAGGLRAGTRRVDEGEGAVVAHVLDDLERLPEIGL